MVVHSPFAVFLFLLITSVGVHRRDTFIAKYWKFQTVHENMIFFNPLENYFIKKPNFDAFCDPNMSSTIIKNLNITYCMVENYSNFSASYVNMIGLSA